MTAMPEPIRRACEPHEEAGADAAHSAAATPRRHPRLTTSYLSRDRVLGLLQIDQLPTLARKQALAIALKRSFTASCEVLFVGRMTIARLLLAHGVWRSQPTTQRRGTRS
jgi:hypothetical protein